MQLKHAIVTALVFAMTSWAMAEVEIGALILNRTQTRFGQDFHRDFVTMWTPPRGISQDYTIVIQEKANPRWGSLILIFVNDAAVYKTFLGVRTRDLKEIVKEGVDAANSYLVRLMMQSQMLEGKDMSGDGLE